MPFFEPVLVEQLADREDLLVRVLAVAGAELVREPGALFGRDQVLGDLHVAPVHAEVAVGVEHVADLLLGHPVDLALHPLDTVEAVLARHAALAPVAEGALERATAVGLDDGLELQFGMRVEDVVVEPFQMVTGTRRGPSRVLFDGAVADLAANFLVRQEVPAMPSRSTSRAPFATANRSSTAVNGLSPSPRTVTSIHGCWRRNSSGWCGTLAPPNTIRQSGWRRFTCSATRWLSCAFHISDERGHRRLLVAIDEPIEAVVVEQERRPREVLLHDRADCCALARNRPETRGR